MNKHKNLGRLATLISIVRWIGLIVMVGGSAYVLIARASILRQYSGAFAVSTLMMVLSLVAVIVVAFFIWLATEVVVQVLRHFMRMEMLALHGPSAFSKPQPYQVPAYGQAPPQATPTPDYYAQPDQPPPNMTEGV